MKVPKNYTPVGSISFKTGNKVYYYDPERGADAKLEVCEVVFPGQNLILVKVVEIYEDEQGDFIGLQECEFSVDRKFLHYTKP